MHVCIAGAFQTQSLHEVEHQLCLISPRHHRSAPALFVSPSEPFYHSPRCYRIHTHKLSSPSIKRVCKHLHTQSFHRTSKQPINCSAARKHTTRRANEVKNPSISPSTSLSHHPPTWNTAVAIIWEGLLGVNACVRVSAPAPHSPPCRQDCRLAVGFLTQTRCNPARVWVCRRVRVCGHVCLLGFPGKI